MKCYTSYEIQDISSEFRNVARRLCRTDYSQCDANLKRFMSVIQTQELISDFINRYNTHPYDIQTIVRSRDWLDPFGISPVVDEEISLEVQMLTYAVEQFDGDFTRLYGTHYYTSAKSTVNDEMRKFIEHVIDPLIDHIGEYLRQYYEKIVRMEEKDKPVAQTGITANNSTVVIGSKVDGNISTQVSIDNYTKTDAEELIATIRDTLQLEELENQDDITKILKLIEEDIKANKKPKKGLLTALKTLCTGGAAVIPLVTALVELLSKVI